MTWNDPDDGKLTAWDPNPDQESCGCNEKPCIHTLEAEDAADRERYD